MNTLRQWREECPKGELNLVFPNGVGNVEQMWNIHELTWYPLQKKCGLTVDTGEKDAEGNPILGHRYGFHMLRRAAASLFVAYLGWTPKRLQTVMGHSSINMTFDFTATCLKTPKRIAPTWRKSKPQCGPLNACDKVATCERIDSQKQHGRTVL